MDIKVGRNSCIGTNIKNDKNRRLQSKSKICNAILCKYSSSSRLWK